jgi:hypothetical protein
LSYDLSKWEIHTHEGPYHPIMESTCVKIIAHILHLESGAIRAYRTWDIYEPDDGPHPSTFNWEENNYKCDCNRHLFFHRANGHEAEDDAPCGESMYAVNLANAKTGEVYYREFASS